MRRRQLVRDDKKDEIRLGKGGVDDAEDGEVILHEYGHAIHFAQDFEFSTARGRRDQRGLRRLLGGDRLAARPRAARPAGVARPGLRRGLGCGLVRPDRAALPAALDAGLTYPDDLVGEVHADGRIWSQALWAVRTAIGSVRADTAILVGQFGFDGGTMPASPRTSSPRPTSLYGRRRRRQVEAAFASRGIL